MKKKKKQLLRITWRCCELTKSASDSAPPRSGAGRRAPAEDPLVGSPGAATVEVTAPTGVAGVALALEVPEVAAIEVLAGSSTFSRASFS